MKELEVHTTTFYLKLGNELQNDSGVSLLVLLLLIFIIMFNQNKYLLIM